MHRFWTDYIKPIIEAAAPARIMEVGAESGRNTEHLLAYCRRSGAKLDVVDPAPVAALSDILARHHAELSFHAAWGLDAIRSLPAPDLVLMNGDQNWATVYNELQWLYLRAAASGHLPPIVLLHNTAWPYGRRDMYLDPGRLDHADRHPYAFRGMLPGQSDLGDAGFNGTYANALHEGGPRNGVLTAAEDFQASCGIQTTLHLLPFFQGLGILVPHTRMMPQLNTVISSFFAPAALLRACEMLDQDAMRVRAELTALKTILSNRAAVLARLDERLNKKRVQASGPNKTIIQLRRWAWRLRSRLSASGS